MRGVKAAAARKFFSGSSKLLLTLPKRAYFESTVTSHFFRIPYSH